MWCTFFNLLTTRLPFITIHISCAVDGRRAHGRVGLAGGGTAAALASAHAITRATFRSGQAEGTGREDVPHHFRHKSAACLPRGLTGYQPSAGVIFAHALKRVSTVPLLCVRHGATIPCAVRGTVDSASRKTHCLRATDKPSPFLTRRSWRTTFTYKHLSLNSDRLCLILNEPPYRSLYTTTMLSQHGYALSITTFRISSCASFYMFLL